MIPRKIHYIWLGEKPKSKLTIACINSWRRNLPEYEIYEWNEKNIDIEKLCKNNKFLKKCYKLKLWAFVSDYLRLYILEKNGGIYFDTDVEVLKSFDCFLMNKMFIGYEANSYIGTAVIGAEKNNFTIKKLLKFYDNNIWNVSFFNNPIIFKYVLDNEPDSFTGCIVYPQEYFSPYEPETEEKLDVSVETVNTYSIHWYTYNWNMSRKGYVFLNTKHIRNPVKKCIVHTRKNLGYLKSMYRKYV